MTPEYLYELADIADPHKLWKRSGLDRETFTPEQRLQVDAGVALRRHAEHVRRLRNLLGTGESLLITPMSSSAVAVMSVPTPEKHRALLERCPEQPTGACAGPSAVTK